MTECASCHQEIQEGFSFCPSCGAAAPGAEAPKGPAEPPAPAAQSMPQPAPGLTEVQIAEQMQLMAEQQAEKERKKAERAQLLAEKKAARQQRQAERKVLQQHKKEERIRKLAEKKALKAGGMAAGASIPASGAMPANTFTATWVLVVIGTILAMGAAGAAAFLIVRNFF